MPMVIGTSGWQYRDWRGNLLPPGRAGGKVAGVLRCSIPDRREQRHFLPAGRAEDIRRLARPHA